jgi:hypothetical protein
MRIAADTERRLRDANPTPTDLPISNAAWSSAELLDRIDIQALGTDPADALGLARVPAHRTRGPLIAIGAALAITVPILIVALFANTRPEGDVVAPTTTTPTTTVADVAPPPEANAVPPTIEITSVDYAYLGVPALVPSRTEFDFVNASSDEFHMMLVMRLDSDDERTAQELTALQVTDILDSEGRERFGTIKAIIGAEPGDPYSVFNSGNNRVSEPGRYVIFCINSVGEDLGSAAAAFADGPLSLPGKEHISHSAGPPSHAGMDSETPHYGVGEFAEFIIEG